MPRPDLPLIYYFPRFPSIPPTHLFSCLKIRVFPNVFGGNACIDLTPHQKYFHIISHLRSHNAPAILSSMKTTIYACYLPGSTAPDYVGSHASSPPDNSPSRQWRYDNCIYLGQGAWIDKETGALIGLPRLNQKTQWGAVVMALPPAQRLMIRIVTLAEVPTHERWKAEAHAIRQHQPPYNAALKDGPDARRLNWNAYQRGYRKDYLTRNPDKAEAKRTKDRERKAAQRAQSLPAQLFPPVA